MSKRRSGYPSETCVKRGIRIVHGHKELSEKLGRNDPCPCGSTRRFKNCCLRTKRYDGALRNHYFFILIKGDHPQFYLLDLGRGAQ